MTDGIPGKAFHTPCMPVPAAGDEGAGDEGAAATIARAFRAAAAREGHAETMAAMISVLMAGVVGTRSAGIYAAVLRANADLLDAWQQPEPGEAPH